MSSFDELVADAVTRNAAHARIRVVPPGNGAAKPPQRDRSEVDYDTERADGADRAEPPPLRIVSPAGLVGFPPPREWIAEDWLPCGVVSGIYGNGGTGKSLIAQQLQTSMAVNKSWLGLDVMQAPSLGVYCEDDNDELWRRHDAICAAYEIDRGATRDVHWISRLGQDNLLMVFARNGVGEITPFHRQVLEAALDLKARMVAVDTAADTFGGSENDRGQVRQYVQRALGSIALRIKGSVLCCAHPSRTGLSSGEGDGGSTGWSNAFRSRAYLSAPAGDKDGGEPLDPDARILQRRKANYAARNDQIHLRWSGGCFALDGAGAAGGIDRLAADTKAEAVFTDLLAVYLGEGRDVSPNRSNTFAATEFAKHPVAKAKGVGKDALEAAMNRLLGAGHIRIEPIGPPSKRTKRLVFVPPRAEP